MGALGLQIVSGILSDEIKKTGLKHVKGIYTEQRDKAVMCRLYYHFKLKGLRYDRALQELNSEFFLGETTLAQIIMRERDLLELLKNDQADKRYLALMFPHYNWN